MASLHKYSYQSDSSSNNEIDSSMNLANNQQKSGTSNLKHHSDFFNVFSDLPMSSRRGSKVINEWVLNSESCSFPADEINEISSETKQEIHKLFEQECADEVESPTLKIHKIHRTRETSSESRIFQWLDDQQIYQVNPSLKREDYYDSKRQSLMRLTTNKQETSQIERVKQSVLQLSKVSNSPLLNRRLNTVPKQAATKFRFEQQPAVTVDQEEEYSKMTQPASQDLMNTAKIEDLNGSDFKFRIHHVSSTASTISLNSSSFSSSNLTGIEQCNYKNQLDQENLNVLNQQNQGTSLYLSTANQESLGQHLSTQKFTRATQF